MIVNRLDSTGCGNLINTILSKMDSASQYGNTSNLFVRDSDKLEHLLNKYPEHLSKLINYNKKYKQFARIIYKYKCVYEKCGLSFINEFCRDYEVLESLLNTDCIMKIYFIESVLINIAVTGDIKLYNLIKSHNLLIDTNIMSQCDEYFNICQ